MIVGKSENDRPVAPGPALEQRVAAEHVRRRRRWRHTPPGRVARRVEHLERARRRPRSSSPVRRAACRARGRGRRRPTASGRRGAAAIGASTASPRTSTAALMWSLCPWVQTMATTRAAADRRRRSAPASWAASMTSTSSSSPTQPDVVLDVEVLAVEREDAVRADEVDARRHRGAGSEHHHRAEHLAALHLVERLLDLVERDRLRHEPVEVEAALQVEVDEQRGSRGVGRQSPYHDGLSAPPRPKNSIIGISSAMSGVGTPTWTTVPARSRAKNACCSTSGRPTASMHDVGAVAVGELPGWPRRGRPSTRRRCGWRRTPWPTRASGGRGRRR